MTRFTIMRAAAFAVAVAAAPAAQAQNQTINSTSQNVIVSGVTFTANNGDVTGENTGGGSVAITNTRPNNFFFGDTGSLEIHGDRSRYVIGDLYGTLASTGFSLSQLSALQFNWNVDQTTASQLHAAPVARVIVADSNGMRAELIWEHVYNDGTAGVAPPLDQWRAGGLGGWYANLRGPNGNVFGTFAANSQGSTAGFGIIDADGQGRGVLGYNGGQVNLELDQWASLFSANAKVVGFSFGAGSGFGAGFTGFVDNVQIITNQFDWINFEPGAVSGVPEPATWAMLMIGFGAMGASLRVRRKRAKITFA